MGDAPRESSLLTKRSDAMSALVVASHAAFALAPVYIACVAGIGWWLAPLTLWFGAGMNSMLLLMHECSHYHVFKSKGACTALGRWLLGPMALADFESYRQRHWEHHRSLGTDVDPKYVYHTSIRGWKLPMLFIKCLVLFEPAQRFTANLRGGNTKAAGSEFSSPEPADTRWVGRAILFHVLLTASLAGVTLAWREGNPVRVVAEAAIAYGIVYLYGLAAVTVFFASLRAIAEHQIGGDNAPHQNDAALRNFRVNLFTRWLFGAYGFADHYTHHMKPAIPYYRLSRATEEMAEKEPALAPTTSYLRTLRMLAATGAGAAKSE